MSLTDEQIAKMFNKNVDTKTILVSKNELHHVIDTNIKDGWKLIRTTEINDRVKVTFQREK